MATRLNDIILDGIERAIREVGLATIGASIAGTIVVLGGLGLFWDPKITLAVIVVGFLVLCFVAVVGSLIDRRRVYRRFSDVRQILTRYAKEIEEGQTPDAFEIIRWSEAVTVDRKGTAHIERRIKLAVGSAPLKAFWVKTNQEPEPPNHAYKKRLVFGAGLVQGEGQVSMPAVEEWNQHCITVYVHLLQPQEPRSCIEVFVRLSWPQYFDHFFNGNTVPVEWTFRRSVEEFEYSLELPSNRLKQRSVGVATFRNTAPVPTCVQSGAGQRLTWTRTGIPPGTNMGFNMQLR